MNSIAYGLISFYMLMVLARWAAPWIRLDLRARAWNWIRVGTDPALRQVRRMMPDMGGAMDWSFPALLMVLWLIRMLIAGR
ncbi:MAG TPA: YggT family protein [Candidatus Hydrogenedentes bacterium]|nr:YggT family protein [Candidatus Hydrogenedentota bacterium]HOJ67251.1 YggT family protein [Candidatus Hydrogenedentota bacterium]HOK88420.1 YggT family protein [Candidatus Hydrogenedentota bacterium]HOV61792.1 YggT family protein [Candidatus Hydrogenedentota bacterium]HPO30297.1 YggT family protein [Candidatus Hydrogenedentota bacterium]